MTREDLSGHARRIAASIEVESSDYHGFIATNAQACEFLRKFAGENSAFFQLALNAMGDGIPEGADKVSRALLSFAEYIDTGLLEEISPERRAQLDVVSDLLEQAQSLLDTGDVHPAAPAVLIGATLEEFLRTWIEQKKLSLGDRKRGLDAYVQVLREADLINKQDAKDITAWAGLRNHAAHGEWDHVGTKANVSLMLQGVNLFMRSYQSGNAV
jgi:hypothetical protein